MNSLLSLSVGLDKLPDNSLPIAVRLPPSDNVELLLSFDVDEANSAIMFQSENGAIRTLFTPLTNTHRVYRNKVEICDKHGDTVVVLESNSYDFYKIILGE